MQFWEEADIFELDEVREAKNLFSTHCATHSLSCCSFLSFAPVFFVTFSSIIRGAVSLLIYVSTGRKLT
jgi:hypothetical protein